jgi:hypothetical protein
VFWYDETVPPHNPAKTSSHTSMARWRRISRRTRIIAQPPRNGAGTGLDPLMEDLFQRCVRDAAAAANSLIRT